MTDDAPMANKRKDEALDPRSDNPSQNSRLHAATKIQSPVSPEDYPEAEREAQLDAAGVRPSQQKPRR